VQEGIRAIVIRTINAEPTLWDAILPEQCRGLPPGLAGVDELLDDWRFFEPFRPYFDSRYGRPSIPIETYLRMMVLKYRYRLGFESLCREVADSIAWRRFCRIPLDCPVPHPSTLEKITVRVGEATIARLNDELVVKAAENKVIKTDRVRADTTVVPANVTYPSDAGLLARGVARLSRLAGQLKGMGLAKRTRFRDRTRAMRRRGHAIGTWLRRRSDEAKEEVLALTAEMAAIAEAAVADAADVARNARRKLESLAGAASGRAVGTLLDLEEMVSRVDQVIDQTRARLAGHMPDGATRLVSLHDPHARPIRKGRIGKPVEFGYKGQVVDNADGIVLDHQIMMGNPADGPLLVPAIKRIIARVGRVPRAVTADRGYGEARIEAELEGLGVKEVAIPRKGRPSAARQQLQHSGRFTKLVKWRTGCEGRIASLKRGAGWGRTLMDGLDGTTIWCGWGILAHNSFKIAALLHPEAAPPHGRDRRRPPRPAGHGPPPGPPSAA
jgi:IS5 family transposase